MKKAIGVLAFLFLACLSAQAQEGGGNVMGPGMMDGRGSSTGSGMMGGNVDGMGTEMMGGYYSQSPECQEFYNQTVDLRMKLNGKIFEYFEIKRNPTATEEATGLEQEIKELREKISAKASPGCRW